MIRNKLVCCLVVVSVTLGVLLPGVVMNHKNNTANAEVNQVPAEYYVAANMALDKNYSLKLSEEDKVKLCTGEWKSNVYPCMDTELNDIAFNAITKAKKACIEEGIYNFDGWYSYEPKAYKAIEATFNNYVAYFWEVTFIKYDKTDELHLTVTEGGTVLKLIKRVPSKRLVEGYREFEIYNIIK